MKLHRFYLSQKLEDVNSFALSDSDIIHQIKNVLRLREGEQIVLLDGVGSVFFAEIIGIHNKEINLKKVDYRVYDFDTVVKNKIKLCPAILKKDKFDLVIQKITEIGVSHVLPIVSHRTEKQNLNYDRLNKIIKEALEQSEKIFLPILEEAIDLEDAIKKDSDYENFYLEIDAPLIKVNELKSKDRLRIFVGPEGGWSQQDIQIFSENGVAPVSLGQTVLRAETASIAIASILKLG